MKAFLLSLLVMVALSAAAYVVLERMGATMSDVSSGPATRLDPPPAGAD